LQSANDTKSEGNDAGNKRLWTGTVYMTGRVPDIEDMLNLGIRE